MFAKASPHFIRNLLTRELMNAFCRVVGKRPPVLMSLRPFAMASAVGLERLWEGLGRQTEPPLSTLGMAIFSMNADIDCQRAAAELDLNFDGDCIEALEDSVRWYVAHS